MLNCFMYSVACSVMKIYVKFCNFIFSNFMFNTFRDNNMKLQHYFFKNSTSIRKKICFKMYRPLNEDDHQVDLRFNL